MSDTSAWVIAHVPLRYRTAVRYWYRSFRGRLDRELPILKRLTRPGARVVDVGANAGLYAYAFGRSAPVEAFEPLPEPARALRALAATLPSIHVHEVALSDRPGTAPMYVPRIDGKPNSERGRLDRPAEPHVVVVVPVRTLDEYAFRDVGLLKIDVEGHERAVLEGGADTIARERPVLLIEIEQRHSTGDITDTFQAVTALGYRGYFLDDTGAIAPLEAFRYEQHQAPYLHNDTDPRYVNDFLFLHQSDENTLLALCASR